MNTQIPYRWKRISLELYKIPVFELGRYFNTVISHFPVRPRSATIDITKKCNSRCITCKQWQEEPTDELSTEEVSDVMAQLKHLGFLSIGFGGGEPLLRQDMAEIIRSARELKFDRISIGSNGLILTEKRAIELIESGMTDIGISIEGTEDIHDYCRGIKGGYRKSMTALENLVHLRDTRYSHLNISLLTILMSPNMDQVPGLIEICRKLRIYFSLALLDTSSYFFEDEKEAEYLRITDQEKLDELIDKIHRMKKENPGTVVTSHAALEFARRYFKDPLQKNIPCLLGNINLYINSFGDVYTGCYGLNPIGNVRERKLKDIIHSREYREQVLCMFRKQCPGCSCNYPTNLAYHLPSRIEEIQWGFGIKGAKSLSE